MISEIPLRPIPDQTLQVTLDGQDCEIRVRQLGNHVYVSLSVDDRKIVDNGIGNIFTAVNTYPSRYFKGLIFFFDSVGKEDPEWEGLGKRWKLLYVTEGARRFKQFTQEV